MPSGRPKLSKHVKRVSCTFSADPGVIRDVKRIYNYSRWLESLISANLGNCPLCNRVMKDLGAEERLRSYYQRRDEKNEANEAALCGDDEEREDGGSGVEGTGVVCGES